MKTLSRFFRATLPALVLTLPACQQEDPASATELVVLAAEKERLKGELEKAKAEIDELKNAVGAAERQTEAAVTEAKQEAGKGIDKTAVQLSFLAAVNELQKKVEEKYPGDKVESYKIFDINFPSENPISSSVSFAMADSGGTARDLSFEGSANKQGVWNFEAVKEIAARKPVVKAPAEAVANATPVEPQNTETAPPQRTGVIRRPSSNDKVFEIKWPD